MGLSTHARHRATGRTRAISLLVTASAVAAAVTGAVVLSGGTYALWTESTAVPTLKVTSGSLAITATSAFDETLWATMIPGEKVRQPFTVTNAGTVPAVLSATAASGSAGFEVRLASGACPTTALTGSAVATTPRTLGTVAAGASTTVCLELAVTAAATAGQQVTFSVSLTGSQVS